MKNNQSLAIIGGYDMISKAFFAECKKFNDNSIFINLNNNQIKNKKIYNFKIFQLKKIFDTLRINKINTLLFLGKINRPNLSNFKNDGEIEKYIPILLNSYQQGDGKILSSVLEIFIQNGFRIISPREVSKSFFLNTEELDELNYNKDAIDVDKSKKLLNKISKFDNAQSIVCVSGYIIAIEAAEGTDNLLNRVFDVRKNLNQLKFKAGILVKIPKKSQSKLVDLPVIGLNTLRLIKKANLNGVAIYPKHTLIHEKGKVLQYAKKYELKIYDAAQ
jgi:DUF1009 family protein